MAELTNELMLSILKDLRSDMGDVKRTLADHSARLAHIESDVGDLKAQFTYALGLASGAGFKAQSAARQASDVETRVDDLTARVEQLEKAH